MWRELLGLRWNDGDLERGTVRVGRALVREGGRHIVGETKTPRGRRQVKLTPRTVSALRRKIVQELLGHVTIAMTLDTYSHYLPLMGDQVSGAMGDALG
jgi:integrase